MNKNLERAAEELCNQLAQFAPLVGWEVKAVGGDNANGPKMLDIKGTIGVLVPWADEEERKKIRAGTSISLDFYLSMVDPAAVIAGIMGGMIGAELIKCRKK